MISKTFKPTIEFISTDSLNVNNKNLIILDTREKNEFNVSHIENAIHVGDQKFNLKKTIKLLDKEKTIIVYCSIGARSDFIGNKIAKKGYTVYNLYGGIFKWINENRELVNNSNTSTTKVHPYNKEWSIWIKPENTSYK